MKTREELEKMFNERFIVNQDIGNGNFVNVNKQCNNFIFETIIPEVLKSVTDIETVYFNNYDYGEKQYTAKEGLQQIKQKAEELYNINL